MTQETPCCDADGSIKAWGDSDSGGTGAPSNGDYTKIYSIDKAHECETVFKTTEDAHPGVVMVMAQGETNLYSNFR
jgi:hypothetical protein